MATARLRILLIVDDEYVPHYAEAECALDLIERDPARVAKMYLEPALIAARLQREASLRGEGEDG